MAVNTRPYFMTLDGVDHMVEATGPAQAVRHVVGAALTELRPARGAEVAKWVREGKPLPIAGQKAAVAETGDDDAAFTAGDAYLWLADWTVVPQDDIKPIWERIVAAKRMTLDDFDKLRTGVPKFGEAIAAMIDGGEGVITVDGVRAQLEDSPAALDIVVGLIGEAKRDENFLPVAKAPA